MSALVEVDVDGMIFLDKVIRVRPNPDKIESRFRWRLFQVPAMRDQLEAAARTAVGNFAIGGKDIKTLRVPLPSLELRRSLVLALGEVVAGALSKRTEATTLRQSTWSAFESALFTASADMVD